jgi:hypothetical protein
VFCNVKRIDELELVGVKVRGHAGSFAEIEPAQRIQGPKQRDGANWI